MKRHLLILVLFIILSFNACSPYKTVGGFLLTFDPPDKAIYGENDVEQWKNDTKEWFCKNEECTDQDVLNLLGLPSDAESFWKPSEVEIKQFNKALKNGLKQARKTHKSDPPGRLKRYEIQYVGFIQNGEKYIIAQGDQCYHPADCSDVSNGWLIIFDGGTSVFTAVFNIKDKTLKGPWFNGYA